jgi:hypothetical protein
VSGWPRDVPPTLPVVHPWAWEARAQGLMSGGFGLQGVASAAYPTANRALLIPFTPTRDMRPALWYWHNGATVSGNVEVGVWDAALQKVASSGSVAQAGVNAFQSVAAAGGTVIKGGRTGYLVVCVDNTTATLFRLAPSGTLLNGLGVLMLATSLPLPTSLAGAVGTNASYVPLFGFSERSFL